MDTKRMEYTFAEDESDFDVVAKIGGWQVGRAGCIRDGDRLHLGDIRVKDDFSPPWPYWHYRLVQLIGQRRPRTMRGQRIGEELLMRLLARADAAGIRETWGSVMPDAIKEQPFLLGWYESKGFVVMEPDGECMRGAAKKIVRKADRLPAAPSPE